MNRGLFLSCVGLVGSMVHAMAAVDFSSDVQPVFEQHCLKCHGPDKQKGTFRLDRRSAMLKGGESGEPAIVPGKPEASFLLKLVRHEEADLEMPPKKPPLSPANIALLEQWITEGAGTPESYGPDHEDVPLSHWAFQAIRRPNAVNNIDGFIQRTLADKGLTMSRDADRRTLARRLFLVMLGLPPSPEQVQAFVDDSGDDAWARLIEQVLASPDYGERWATYWLDLVRFGETHGYEMNRERPTAWPYRDWVIASFNEDKPYNDFAREQIAGDALGVDIGTSFLVAGPVDQVKGSDPKLRQTQRMNELDDMINTTGTAFLGLTTGCARCHNHKFDPISQKDYYAMQAVFAGVKHSDRKLPLSAKAIQKREALNAEIASLTRRLKPFVPDDAAALRPAVSAKHNIEQFTPREAKLVRFTIEKSNGALACIDELEIFSGKKNVALSSLGAKAASSGDFKHALHKLAHINDGLYGNAKSWISAMAKDGWVQIELPEITKIDRIEWARDREGTYADRLAVGYRIESSMVDGQWQLLTSSADRATSGSNSPEVQYVFDGHPEGDQGRQWLDRLNQAEKEKGLLENTATVYAGTFSQPGPTHRLYRGEPDARRERVGPDAITAFGSLDLKEDAPEQQRRLAFANWVASDQNPLTARIIANRLWQFHFGTGIVDTPSDFGQNGTPPTHPELLDWLAVELMENNWSLKYLHRKILLSNTWCQDNKPRPDAHQVDAAARLLWRFPTRRIEAEGIRDAMLTASGVLDRENRGGPGFNPFEVQMENVRHYHAKKKYGPEDWRRMIYMTKIRQEREQVFGAFDCPDASMVVPKRSRSTTPLQALNLLNSPFVMQQAELFAKRLEDETETETACIDRAWQLCFQRPADEAERAKAAAFIQAEGLVQFARALLNANEFVFIP
jgi:hypothetical protein